LLRTYSTLPTARLYTKPSQDRINQRMKYSG
jgi:hypothetical protein